MPNRGEHNDWSNIKVVLDVGVKEYTNEKVFILYQYGDAITAMKSYLHPKYGKGLHGSGK